MPVAGGLVIGSAALSGVKSVADFLGANAQEKRDKAELARLTPAFYEIQDEYFQNNASAAQSAQSGFTQESKDFFTDNVSRGLGTGISGVLSAGGNVNDINKLFQSYSDAFRGFSAEDSEKQINNIRYYHQTNKDLAGQKTIQWGVNEYQPYQAKLKELTQRIEADKINRNNALNGVINSIGAVGTAISNDDLISKLFGDGKGGVKDPDVVSGDYNYMGDENYSRPPVQQSMTMEQQRTDESISDDQLMRIYDMFKRANQNQE
jgi:hypothetical protein